MVLIFFKLEINEYLMIKFFDLIRKTYIQCFSRKNNQ